MCECNTKSRPVRETAAGNRAFEDLCFALESMSGGVRNVAVALDVEDLDLDELEVHVTEIQEDVSAALRAIQELEA